MFPYPSGKLHIGHLRNYAIADAYARHARALGKQVLFPFGWDSFGLPAENAAQLYGVDPQSWTEANIVQMREQLAPLSLSIDWQCELATHRPEFYRHTQALFMTLMRHGLVYKKAAEVWWDEADQTVLANEQVIDGRGWRSGMPATRRSLAMYWIATSRYARELAQEPLAWSAGARADHLAWIGYEGEHVPARLHDWCVSRQRKWGTPVPAVECPACGPVPLNEADLPHTHARMGLACACPVCGGAARTSDETLDTFFDSAWYFLRFPELANRDEAAVSLSDRREAPFDAAARAWTPIDLYVGGREHATMHMLYARFMSRALADCGMGCPREPFVRYLAQGMVKSRAYSVTDAEGMRQWVPGAEVKRDGQSWRLADGREVRDEGVQKMSKSKLNGVDPAEVVATHGVDALRLCLFFSAPFEFDMAWDERALSGCARFAKRMASLAQDLAGMTDADTDIARVAEADLELDRAQRALNRYVCEQFARHEGLNGVVAALMKHAGIIERSRASIVVRKQAMADTCRALFPLAPDLATRCGKQVEMHWDSVWRTDRLVAPKHATATVALQCNGRFVEAVEMPRGIGAQAAFDYALGASPRFAQRVRESGAIWQHAVWVDARVLNAVALDEALSPPASVFN